MAVTKDGKRVTLNKPFRTPDGPKKFAVYVKNSKGNIVNMSFLKYRYFVNPGLTRYTHCSLVPLTLVVTFSLSG